MTGRELRRLKTKRKRRFTLLVLILLGLFFTGKFISNANRLIKIKTNEISYMEFIKFKEDTLNKTSTPKVIRKMASAVESIKGKPSTKDASDTGTINVLNIYFKDNTKIEILRKNSFVSIDGVWYKIQGSSANKFDRLFEEYSE